jgi:hypothetical protein
MNRIAHGTRQIAVRGLASGEPVWWKRVNIIANDWA